MAELKVDHGQLPDWGRSDLPAPPPLNFKNVLSVVGPGTIALSMSIGSGEWLMGPGLSALYGPSILWITTVAVILQVIFNMECARYVLYTGETCFSGYMRCRPGPKFWGWAWVILGFLHVGWPGWAGGSAAALFSAFMGKLPGAPDKGAVMAFTYLCFALVVLALLWGGTVQRGLEKISTIIVLWIAFFLVVFNLVFVDAATWWKVFKGLFAFGQIPKGVDILLLGAFAAYSGAGGIGNIFTASWMRDKGYGMGSIVGAIPSAIGGREIKLSKIGSIFDPSKGSNMANWKTWWKYLWWDQGAVFGGGCIIGMYLCVLIAVAIIPAGMKITGMAAGAYQAEYMWKFWAPLWFLALFTGFWILWGTQLAVMDGFVRVVTDVIWSSTKKPHEWKAGQRVVYYLALLIFVVWGCIAINMAQPMVLIMIGANMAGFIFVVGSFQQLIVNNTMLPKEVRPSWWQNIGIICCGLFYLYFALALIGKQTGWWSLV
jgi:uncharacterized protein YhhL (DUF1145 family)